MNAAQNSDAADSEFAEIADLSTEALQDPEVQQRLLDIAFDDGHSARASIAARNLLCLARSPNVSRVSPPPGRGRSAVDEDGPEVRRFKERTERVRGSDKRT